MDTSRRDMLLASLLATLPAMVVSEAVASPINPAQTIIRPPGDHHWVSNKNYPERSVDMCPLAGSLTEPGLYLTLVRWWPGYMSAPHTYITDRLCVVVSPLGGATVVTILTQRPVCPSPPVASFAASLVHRIMMG